MILTWAKHQGGPAAHPITYFLASDVRKSVAGRSAVTTRHPAPELLHGAPAVIARYIDALPYRCRYRSCVLSFAEDDLDVSAFARGDRQLRVAVGGAVRLLYEVAYAGVPIIARPPVLAATHTHLGRLEVNVLLPRAVGAPCDRLRSINPHPPGATSRDDWDAYIDVVNQTFGWADPRCPMRRCHVTPPSWMAKEAAELLRRSRAGARATVDPRDPRYRAWALCRQATAAGATMRDEIVAHVDAGLMPFGWGVTSQSRHGITCGPLRGAGPRITLRGAALGDGAEDAADPFDALVARQGQIARAPDRLREALARRAEDNRRFGGDAWPIVALPDPARLLALPRPLPGPAGALSRLLGRLADRLMDTLTDLALTLGFGTLSSRRLRELATQLERINDDTTIRPAGRRPHGAPHRADRGSSRSQRLPGRRPAGSGDRGPQPDSDGDDRRRQHYAGRVLADHAGGDMAGPARRGGSDARATRAPRRRAEVHRRGGRAPGRDAGSAPWSRADWLSAAHGVVMECLGARRPVLFRSDPYGQEYLVVLDDEREVVLPLSEARADADWYASFRERLSGAGPVGPEDMSDKDDSVMFNIEP